MLVSSGSLYLPLSHGCKKLQPCRLIIKWADAFSYKGTDRHKQQTTSCLCLHKLVYKCPPGTFLSSCTAHHTKGTSETFTQKNTT